MDVLVAYATKNGSTQQVADAITVVLRDRGAHVTLVHADIRHAQITSRDLVVLGAPLYSGRWHKDASRFLRRHRRDLSSRPVAVFAMGPRRDTGEAWQRSRAQLDRALAKRAWLTPIAVSVFGGVDPPGRREHRDLRNWDIIRTWAENILTAVQTATTAAPPSHNYSGGTP